jgi:hypothetical protein
MSLDFLSLSDDAILEILGHLTALEVIRCRSVRRTRVFCYQVTDQRSQQTCRSLYWASKERSVWLNVSMNTKFPLPPTDLHTMSTHHLETMLTRVEIMYAMWTGTRPVKLHVSEASDGGPEDSPDRLSYCRLMPPYIARADICDDPVTEWHKPGSQSVPICRLPPLNYSAVQRCIDSSSGALYIVAVEPAKPGQKLATM